MLKTLIITHYNAFYKALVNNLLTKIEPFVTIYKHIINVDLSVRPNMYFLNITMSPDCIMM